MNQTNALWKASGAANVPIKPPICGYAHDVLPSRWSTKSAFTLIETLVALIIMVIMMAAIGEVFHLAGSTVRLGQATLSTMASVRVVEAQISHDFRHFDTNEFLVIRQHYYAPPWLPGVQYTPGDEVTYNDNYYLCIHPSLVSAAGNTSGGGSGGGGSGGGSTGSSSGENPSTLPLMWQELYIPPMADTGGPGGGPGGSIGSSSGWTPSQYPVWRADMLTFVADGHFQGRTGSYSGSGSSASLSMSDYLTATKAQIWYGQLTASYGPAAADTGNPELPYWPENSWNPSSIPNGSPAALPSGETAGQFFFGRECILMIPPGSPTWGAGVYSSLNGNGGYWTAPDGETFYQTSSGLDAAYDVGLQGGPGGGPGGGGGGSGSGPQQTLASYLNSLAVSQGNINVPIADPLCNRYGTVATPYDSTHGILNGCIRMEPIMLRGVPSFSVDWTDGSIVPGSNPPQLEWWGLDNSGLPSSYESNLLPGDDGCPETWVFYSQNQQYWPKALKITYLVTDRHNRMQGGHFVTQIIYLPH